MAKKWEEARAAREAKLDGLQERLTGAVETLVSGADWQRAMNFAARFRSRSFEQHVVDLVPSASMHSRPDGCKLRSRRMWRGSGSGKRWVVRSMASPGT